MSESPATADLVDEWGDQLQVCDLQFRHFGARSKFTGTIRTISCYQDNALVKAALNEPGEGQVLVVDGKGSLHTALVGDLIAGAAERSGWAGVVLHGAVRDSVALAGLDLGVAALGTTPRKSGKQGIGVRDEPVGFGGILFRPGDELFADEDGIAVLPAGTRR
ncbi:ribonuclease E activity regulator RraA [Amycolatopsis palatopharyngis]|uniref:ribonuclease E activity regulator RraA n=1 Tax=Amycolatopsis palatopharyngis TaxID=187982 RepID=UPI000E26E542|nr:ribonuclease E activity regulator RraA [Amycolatopsis palatopharyngis]